MHQTERMEPITPEQRKQLAEQATVVADEIKEAIVGHDD